jgi:hypothetical protein
MALALLLAFVVVAFGAALRDLLRNALGRQQRWGGR